MYFYELKKSNKMHLYADIYLLLNYSTCFGRPWRLSSGVHKTVAAASGTDHTIREESLLKRDQIFTDVLSSVTYFVTLEKACFSDSMICTRDCSKLPR